MHSLTRWWRALAREYRSWLAVRSFRRKLARHKAAKAELATRAATSDPYNPNTTPDEARRSGWT